MHPLGGAAGRWITQVLAAEGIPAHIVEIAEETRSTVILVDDEHPTVLAEAGPHLSRQAWAQLHERVAQSCEDGGVLVVSGSPPPRRHPRARHRAHRRGSTRGGPRGGAPLPVVLR